MGTQYEQAARAKLAEIERLKREFAAELKFDRNLQAELHTLQSEFYAICALAGWKVA